MASISVANMDLNNFYFRALPNFIFGGRLTSKLTFRGLVQFCGIYFIRSVYWIKQLWYCSAQTAGYVARPFRKKIGFSPLQNSELCWNVISEESLGNGRDAKSGEQWTHSCSFFPHHVLFFGKKGCFKLLLSASHKFLH